MNEDKKNFTQRIAAMMWSLHLDEMFLPPAGCKGG